MRTGWEIVISGRHFDPAELLRSSRIQPCRTWEQEVATDSTDEKHLHRFIEFTDWHEGPYPLDMATEALDYLEANFAEFKHLCHLPGVETRQLNFSDTLAGHGGSFDFGPRWIATLAELKLAMSIAVFSAKDA